MKPIIITEGISITKTRGRTQTCVACGVKIPFSSVAISLHNYNDGLSLKKNLWLHIGCIDLLSKIIKEGVEEHGHDILVEGI